MSKYVFRVPDRLGGQEYPLSLRGYGAACRDTYRATPAWVKIMFVYPWCNWNAAARAIAGERRA